MSTYNILGNNVNEWNQLGGIWDRRQSGMDSGQIKINIKKLGKKAGKERNNTQK
jgi:hypothetical protein